MSQNIPKVASAKSDRIQKELDLYKKLYDEEIKLKNKWKIKEINKSTVDRVVL